jgi:hypothetical protein
MELKNTDKISSLLHNISLYEELKSYTSSSNQSESQNSKKLNESTVDEKYFHIKLMKLLGITKESSFSNVKIELKSFFNDIEKFLDWVKKEKGINENKALEMINEIKILLKDISKIEIDSFFMNVPGKNVQEFLNNMKSYSFPTIIEKNKILENEKYMILVESTHSIKSVIKKKTEQIRKYHLFFNMLNKYFKMNDIYLRKFHFLFFQKYFHKSDIIDLDELKQKEENEYKVFFEKFILIIATDNSYTSFKETIKKIGENDNNIKFENKFLELNKKTYENENNEIIINNSINNYDKFNFVLKTINKNANWIVKIIFFDMYFDLIIPKCEISEGLININNDINNLKKENNELNQKMDKILEFLNTNFPEKMKEINKFINN